MYVLYIWNVSVMTDRMSCIILFSIILNMKNLKIGKNVYFSPVLDRQVIVILYHPFSFTNVNSLQLFVIEM